MNHEERAMKFQHESRRSHNVVKRGCEFVTRTSNPRDFVGGSVSYRRVRRIGNRGVETLGFEKFTVLAIIALDDGNFF